MTVLIELPGVLSSTAGLEKLIFTKNGFPADGLQDLFLFTDASGTALANAIEGRPGGALEKLVEGDFGGGYAWLTGGGVRLQGTQIASFPGFDPTLPFSLVLGGAITGNVSGAVEAIIGLLAFRDRSTSAVRGPVMFARAFQSGGNQTVQARMWTGTADGGTSDLQPRVTGLVNRHMISVLTYDGSATVTASVYSKTGALLGTVTIAASDVGMTTNAGNVSPLAQPTIGISTSVYDGGIQEAEVFARYSKVLSADDITRICAQAASIGNDRGRPW